MGVQTKIDTKNDYQTLHLAADRNPVWSDNNLEDSFAAFYFVKHRKCAISLILAARAIAFTATLGLLAALLHVSRDSTDFMLYYSHWAFVALATMYAAATTTSIAAYKNSQKYNLKTATIDDRNVANLPPIKIRVQWVAFNVACSSNLMASVAYWASVNARPDMLRADWRAATITSTAHFINSMLVMQEIIMCAIPVRLVDIYQPFIFTSCYGLFYCCYHYITDKNIYRYIDWNMYTLSGIAIMLLAIQTAFYLGICAVDRLKRKIKFL